MSGKVILIIIATINPAGKESLNHYLQSMGKLYQEAGATPVQKYKITDTLIGEESADLVSIMEFPNREALDRVFQSETYKTLIPCRVEAFIKVHAMVAE